MIEAWKRKEKQISYKWGLVRPDDEVSLVQNPKYIGYNKFSWSSLVASKNSRDKSMWVKFVVDVFLTFTLLVASVVAYIVIKMYIKEAMYQGYALSVSVGVINQVYVMMAQYFVDKSNLKYLQDYNNSLLNRLAVFKFVNIHLPIVYALIQFKRSIPELTPDQLSNY